MTDDCGHPESIDPPYFQDLIRKAYEREISRLLMDGVDSEEAWQRAMWRVFELRHNLTDLYKAAAGNDGETT